METVRVNVKKIGNRNYQNSCQTEYAGTGSALEEDKGPEAHLNRRPGGATTEMEKEGNVCEVKRDGWGDGRLREIPKDMRL